MKKKGGINEQKRLEKIKYMEVESPNHLKKVVNEERKKERKKERKIF